ncbi:hypothetical protein GIB67_022673 [Kingdonia uniflora]|uniref:Uncharacterized protein n=1 Tax=Kingdonia uniflora TaxID=39325 RepID=A0A7J7P879_9MAGN|nr:hypothetical protein GIB67_022673 [Kingdonia uniflora]
MCPGLTSFGGAMDDEVLEESPVAMVEGMQHALAIGFTKMSVKDIGTWANPRDYIDSLIDSDEEWVNSVFKKLGIKRKRQKKIDSLLQNVPVTPKSTKKKKRGGEGASKVVEGMEGEKLARQVKYVLKRQRAPKQAATAPEVACDALRQRSKQVSTQAEIRKGKVFPESSRVQQPKVAHHKRRMILGEDDSEDMDEELTMSEWEEQARAKAASMAELCGTDPDEALRQMKKNPATDDAAQTDGVEGDVAAAGSGGVVGTSVVEDIVVRTATDVIVNGAGLNPSTEGTGGVSIEEPVGGDGVATPI